MLMFAVCVPTANCQVYDTDAIRTAVNLCGSGGGGTVIFRAGYTFLTVRVARSVLWVSQRGELLPVIVPRELQGAFNVSSNTLLQVVSATNWERGRRSTLRNSMPGM